MRVDLTLRAEIARSPRVTQLEGMFDVPRAAQAGADYHFDVPIEERDWQIGLITGPSGAGKSSVARAMFGDLLIDGYEWQRGRAIVDCFGEAGIREISGALSSVGFSSPPSWLKPFEILSNGEKFRANLARCLIDADRPLVVMDEFTSLVDRTVGRIGAHAVAKAVRSSPGKRFVAVTCHDDVLEWLQPDWVLEPHAGAFAWRSPRRRPECTLELHRAEHSAWRWFAQHHYLSADLHRAARCFVGLIDGRPAAFAGLLHMPHPKRDDLQSLSRLVVSPDFQGLGLGAHAFADAIAGVTKANGKTLCVGTSHPALIRAWAKSAKWHMTSKPGFQQPPGKSSTVRAAAHAQHRRVAHFQWRGGACPDVAAAKRLWQ